MGEIGITVPLGGNAFITFKEENAEDGITDDGLVNWSSATTRCGTFFHLSQPGSFRLVLRQAVTLGGQSSIRVSLINSSQSFTITLTGSEPTLVEVGTFNVATAGYVQIDLQGITRTGPVFAEVYDLILYEYTVGKVNCIKGDFSFYFGRRGPSVHLRPTLPTGRNLQYFYNEVTVPVGQDVIGSYYMATGFFGGYFGFQVNSETERRILFSIWSAYETDDPGAVPEDYKVELVRKGDDVIVQDFGDEGTGLQSILVHNWEAGQKYKFLVYGSPIPDEEEQTLFTGWFQGPTSNGWQLMSSLMRPKTSTHLISFYSFLENFIPEQGHVERMANFDNQWVRDTAGVWQELTVARFTGDETSRNGRLDVAGGFDFSNGQFYLRNCGFFNDRVPPNIEFIRQPTNMPPEVDLEELP